METLTVGMIGAIAAGYMVWKSYRSVKLGKDCVCSGGCAGCGGSCGGSRTAKKNRSA